LGLGVLNEIQFGLQNRAHFRKNGDIDKIRKLQRVS
jgi:hypothetical protein